MFLSQDLIDSSCEYYNNTCNTCTVSLSQYSTGSEHNLGCKYEFYCDPLVSLYIYTLGYWGWFQNGTASVVLWSDQSIEPFFSDDQQHSCIIQLHENFSIIYVFWPVFYNLLIKCKSSVLVQYEISAIIITNYNNNLDHETSSSW